MQASYVQDMQGFSSLFLVDYSDDSLNLQEAKKIGDEFLALEKYVNLNYLVRS